MTDVGALVRTLETTARLALRLVETFTRNGTAMEEEATPDSAGTQRTQILHAHRRSHGDAGVGEQPGWFTCTRRNRTHAESFGFALMPTVDKWKPRQGLLKPTINTKPAVRETQLSVFVPPTFFCSHKRPRINGVIRGRARRPDTEMATNHLAALFGVAYATRCDHTNKHLNKFGKGQRHFFSQKQSVFLACVCASRFVFFRVASSWHK